MTAVCPGPVRTEFTEVAGMSGRRGDRLPGCVWMSAEDVARHAVDGAEHDKRVVVPGAAQPRARRWRASTRPRAVALPLISRIWRNV